MAPHILKPYYELKVFENSPFTHRHTYSRLQQESNESVALRETEHGRYPPFLVSCSQLSQLLVSDRHMVPSHAHANVSFLFPTLSLRKKRTSHTCRHHKRPSPRLRATSVYSRLHLDSFIQCSHIAVVSNKKENYVANF